MMYRTPSYVEAAPVANFPEGVDVHWETESRQMWNEKERTTEEQELIYEVSWIPELRALAPLSQVQEESAKITVALLIRSQELFLDAPAVREVFAPFHQKSSISR